MPTTRIGSAIWYASLGIEPRDVNQHEPGAGAYLRACHCRADSSACSGPAKALEAVQLGFAHLIDGSMKASAAAALDAA